jgi:hypothetical protein
MYSEVLHEFKWSKNDNETLTKVPLHKEPSKGGKEEQKEKTQVRATRAKPKMSHKGGKEEQKEKTQIRATRAKLKMGHKKEQIIFQSPKCNFGCSKVALVGYAYFPNTFPMASAFCLQGIVTIGLRHRTTELRSFSHVMLGQLRSFKLPNAFPSSNDHSNHLWVIAAAIFPTIARLSLAPECLTII